MFDVVWTDPNIELMGERMVRKEQEAKEKDKNRAASGRQSVSTNSSSSSSDRAFRFFSKVKRKSSTPSRGKPCPSCGSQEDVESDDARLSTYGVKAALSNQDEPEPLNQPADTSLQLHSLSEPEEARSQPLGESSLSKWAHQAAIATGVLDRMVRENATATTKTETFVQTLGLSSSITHTIGTAIVPRTEADDNEVVIETHISSNRIRTQTPPLAEVLEDIAPEPCGGHDPVPPLYICPKTPTRSEPRNHDLWNPEAWKPPHEWDCTPTKKNTVKTIDGRLRMLPACPEANYATFPAFVDLLRERQMMAVASPEVIIANLQSKMSEGSDGMAYKEIEGIKKRWMFSALYRLGAYAQLVSSSAERSEAIIPVKQNRILALYETQASASFLAALYPSIPITHVSTYPLSPDTFPNIQPLQIPSVSVAASSRAIPPKIYSAVTCLSLPSLLPSTDIPPFLRSINRCLAPGGALHLSILDPQPVSSTMGPKFRKWLFTNLLINLEQAFRTTWPSETFPAWLMVGKLRGKGSTIATMTIPVIYQTRGKEDTKTELRCLANRLLWQEIWGKFVTAARWWWEEDEIVQECVELGTHWRYSHIIAVKGEDC